MKFVFISDTHGQHRELDLPDSGEVIIHGGDFCNIGEISHVYDFIDWFDGLDFHHKIFIGGNHDFFAAEQPIEFKKLLPPKMIYLNDSGTEINGISIWGSPVQPGLEGWAFGKKRGKEMKTHWDLIPKHLDLLITHTPPDGILDKSSSGISLGCEELIGVVRQIQPKFHLFGHVHASYGQIKQGGTTFINGSNMDSIKGLVNLPVFFELAE